MSRLSLLTSTAIAALGVTSLSNQPVAQQTLRPQLIGTWLLTSCDAKTPVCSNPKGSAVYAGNGRYTLVIESVDRPKISGPRPAGSGRLPIAQL